MASLRPTKESLERETLNHEAILKDINLSGIIRLRPEHNVPMHRSNKTRWLVLRIIAGAANKITIIT